MLEQFLVSQVFAFLLIFCRVGGGLMLLPGIAEAYVMPRARLGLALTIALVLTPALGAFMPPVPTSPLTLLALITAECLTGIFIGAISRILISTMHVAGMILAVQSGLASATLFDINQAGQGSAIGNLLGMVAVILLFALDLHHVMIRGLTDSYTLFQPGQFPPVGDFASMAATVMGRSFMVAVQFSAPMLVCGFIVYLAGGVLARLMPTMQVFFVIIPPQILISFFLLMSVLSGAMLWYMRYVEDTLIGFIAP